MSELEELVRFAIEVAREAGALGRRHFSAVEALVIESKGHQDLVSNADREVETFIRSRIATAYPEDGIVGEEHAAIPGTSGRTWIIDPIDGTANFVRGIPAWCVVIACVENGWTIAGVIHEPSTDETFSASLGGGAWLNGRRIRVSPSTSLTDGSVGTGFSNRARAENIVGLIGLIVDRGGVFFRNASGALMLAYVAAGRLIGYCEQHMNSWDCLAGLLLVGEAGGTIVEPDPGVVVQEGTVVIASAPGVFDELNALCAKAFNP